MKKNIALILLIISLLLIFTGCASKKNNDFLNQVINKVITAKSFSFNGDSDMTVNNQAAESLKFTGYYKAPAETYTKEQATYLGNNLNVETYQKNNDFYTKIDSNWEKSDPKEAAAIMQSGAGGSPVDFLKDLKVNAKTVYLMPDKIIEGKKYKVLKVTTKTDNLKAKTKKAVQDNLNEITKSALPENKKEVEEQKKQLQMFLKTLQISLTYNVYINPANNELWRVDMEQVVKSVIDNDKTENKQKFTLYFSEYNKTVTMPDVGK